MSAKPKKLKPTVQPTAATGQRASGGHTIKPTLQPSEGNSPPPAPANDTVRFRNYDGSESDWSFVQWKNKIEHQVCEEFFARDGQDRLIVLKPLLPLLPAGHWTAPPFPESNPCLIEPFRLVAPPCRATEAETRALKEFRNADESRGCVDLTHKQARFICFARERFGVVGSVTVPELWELIYGEALAPKSEDDGPLQARLDAALSGWRQEHESRSQEIDALTEADVQRRIYGENATERVSKEQVAKHIQDQRTALDIEFTKPKNRDRFGGCLHTTLADVKADSTGGIRDDYLRQKWAVEQGFDLSAMAREATEFLQWLERRYANLKVNVMNAPPGTFHYDFRLSSAEQLAVLASVRYVLHFTTGERVYIAGLAVRDKLREEEEREAGEVEPRNVTPAAPPLAQSSAPLPASGGTAWHSEDFDQVWWVEDGQEQQFSLTVTQARAVKVLDEAHGMRLSTEGWIKAIYDGWKDYFPATMTPRKIFTTRDNLPVWRKLFRRDGRHYELVPPIS